MAILFTSDLKKSNAKYLMQFRQVRASSFSPIAMAMLKDGRSRIGEHILVKDHARNIEAVCEVCSLVHLDPEGEKLRG